MSDKEQKMKGTAAEDFEGTQQVIAHAERMRALLLEVTPQAVFEGLAQETGKQTIMNRRKGMNNE